MKTLPLPNFILMIFFVFSINQTFAQIHFRSYHEGRYYDLAGVKHVGFIDFTADLWGNPKINFKSDSLASENQKIDIKDIKCVVVYRKNELYRPELDTINTKDTSKIKQLDPHFQPKMVSDSLVVLNEDNDNSFNPTTIRLCKFVTEAVHSKIYSRQESRSTPGIGMMGSSGMLTYGFSVAGSYSVTVYLCELDGKVFKLRRSNFKEALFSAFSDDAVLIQKIKTKEYRYGDMETIIGDYLRFKSK